MARSQFMDRAQLSAASARTASELISSAGTPASEAAYLALATSLEVDLDRGVSTRTPPDIRFWREVVAELRRRAWRV